MKPAGASSAKRPSPLSAANPRARVALLCAAALVLLPGSGHALDSVALTDVIRSSGTGNIDLLKDATAADVETFRSENGGVLLFAVDVNEAADGSEKASSQAVTLDTVELRATIGGTEHVFSSFSTDTQALLARAGTTERVPFYTLIGDSGSNRIVPNNIQERYDAVVEVPVNLDLSAATAIELDVVLLNVNSSLGDPEAFYDYSNGFEDVALINGADAVYLRELAPGRDEAPVVIAEEAPTAWTSFPSATGYYTVGYEDSFPNRGDYDFNDLLVAYRVEAGLDGAGDLVAMRVTAFLIGRGAGFSHDWHLRIALPVDANGTVEATLTEPETYALSSSLTAFSGDLDLAVFDDTRALFPPPQGATYTNTEAATEFVLGPRFDATITFDAPVPGAALPEAPFDPYIVVRNTGYEVHLADQPPTPGSLNAAEGLTDSRDSRGYPFSFVVPTSWPLPWEKTDVGIAYPELSLFVQSGEKTHLRWYDTPAAGKTRSYAQPDWEWAVPPN